MTSYLKHNHAYGNNLTGGSTEKLPFTPWTKANVTDKKIIIVDSKSVLFGSTSKWEEREQPSKDWVSSPNSAGNKNTPAQILYNICVENQGSMIYVLSDYYNEGHFEKFNQMVDDNKGGIYPPKTNIVPGEGIKNLTIMKYSGANKKNKMSEILNSDIGKDVANKNGDIIYITRNYRGGNSNNSIIKNNETQKESIHQTIIKINPGYNGTVKATTAHIPLNIFYKHYLKSPSQLMYRNGSDMLQSYSNATPADISYGPFMKSPQAYKRDNQWLWPPHFKTTDDKQIENGELHSTYMNNNQNYKTLYNNGEVNSPFN